MLGGVFPEQTAAIIALGILSGLGCGLFIGLINGLCVAFLRVSPFMVTLGTLSIATGLALLLTQGIPVYGMPDVFVTEFGRALWFGLPTTVYVAAAIVLLVWFVQTRTRLGRYLYAVGGNLQAATLSGVKVKSIVFWIFVNMGVLSAVAGIIFAGRHNQAGPTAGNSFELDAIAAAFIGGAAVQGGVGKVVGAITGGLIMGVINNGMSLLGAPSERVMLIKGLVLLAAVAFDIWAKRRAGTSR
jgi:ribose/xylose/arabinose/galactoside ABC-type transport system permease subunit